MKKSSSVKYYLSALAGLILLVLADQFTKLLAVRHLKDQESLVLVKGVFELHYLENRGMAFGLLQNQRGFFVIATTLALLAAVYFYYIVPKTKRYFPIQICIVFLTAGALGNFIDRILLGYVVDFFYFSLIDFPIFNVADIYVTVTFAVLVLLIFFYYKEEDLEVFTRKYRKEQRENEK